MITREQLVKIARDVIGNASYRPSDECSDASTIPGEQFEHNCPLAVTNPASHDVPDWVVESMRRAYEQGREHATTPFLAVAIADAFERGRAQGHDEGAKLESERPF